MVNAQYYCHCSCFAADFYSYNSQLPSRTKLTADLCANWFLGRRFNSRPNKAGLKCPSVYPSVLPQKVSSISMKCDM